MIGNQKIVFGDKHPLRYNNWMLKMVFRKTVVLACLAALGPVPLWAGQRDRTSPGGTPDFSVLEKPPQQKADESKLHSPASGSCAEYGAGFMKVAGSDTCVRIGGSVSVDAGVAR